MVELLGINYYLFCSTYEQSSQNNQFTWYSSVKHEVIFFQMEAFHEVTNILGKKDL